MQRFPFFDKISKKSQDILLGNSMKATMPEGVELFYQDEKCKDILFLTDGTVRVYR